MGKARLECRERAPLSKLAHRHHILDPHGLRYRQQSLNQGGDQGLVRYSSSNSMNGDKDERSADNPNADIYHHELDNQGLSKKPKTTKREHWSFKTSASPAHTLSQAARSRFFSSGLSLSGVMLDPLELTNCPCSPQRGWGDKSDNRQSLRTLGTHVLSDRPNENNNLTRDALLAAH